jgi:predicted amidophosphoribosyltransferase
MSHKECCRACGMDLTPISTCNICEEYVSWVCGRCEKIEDVTHIHTYSRYDFEGEKLRPISRLPMKQ